MSFWRNWPKITLQIYEKCIDLYVLSFWGEIIYFSSSYPGSNSVENPLRPCCLLLGSPWHHCLDRSEVSACPDSHLNVPSDLTSLMPIQYTISQPLDLTHCVTFKRNCLWNDLKSKYTSIFTSFHSAWLPNSTSLELTDSHSSLASS